MCVNAGTADVAGTWCEVLTPAGGYRICNGTCVPRESCAFSYPVAKTRCTRCAAGRHSWAGAECQACPPGTR
jgi:hypothetical protein